MGTERQAVAGAPGPAAAPPDLDVARTVAVLSRLLERELGDMTLPQLRVLLLVSRSPERAGRLASQAAVSRPSLTGVLDGLVARGWVRRREVAVDRRGVRLEVTAAGRRALADARDAMDDRLGGLLAQIEPERRQVAVDGLVALGEAVDAELARRRRSEGER